MSDELKELIRIAHKHPPLRRELVPMVRRARAPRWSGTVSGDKMRVRWAKHPDNAMLIEELPTKPLKRRLRRADFSMGRAFPGFGMPDQFLMTNLVRDAKFSSSMSYEQAVAAMKKALKKAAKDAENVMADHEKQMVDQYPFESQVFYLEVEPADYQEIQAAGKDFTLTAHWDNFKAYSPQGIDPQEGMGSFIKEQSKGGARKLYKMLKAEPNLLKNVSWMDLSDWLSRNKIGSDYVGSVWR